MSMHFASYYRWLVYQHLFGAPRATSTLLDIGCDDGGFVARIPARTSVALDLNLASLRRAHTNQKVCADGTRMPFRDAVFDLVIVSDVIEHVEDDVALLAQATRHVRHGGTLWLSTTAAQFTLFPPQITARAERSWGHVRKGYVPERLVRQIGDGFDCELVEWPETIFRHIYVLLWLCAKWSPTLARGMAYLCFLLDQRWRSSQRKQGHLYVQAVRHQR
jgi:SAM-dependent methyltransferase